MTVAIVFKIINKREVCQSEDRLRTKQESIYDTELNEDKSITVGSEIGKLKIPHLNIEGIIVEGVDEENIKYNIGHFPECVMPGEEGNFAVAGHRGTLNNNVFNDLHNIEENDEIIIESLNGTYIYKVTDSFIVNPTETEILNTTPRKSEITIVTCTLDGKERLIVKGILIEEEG